MTPGDATDDAEAALLARVAAGEREAPLVELYDVYGPRMYALGVRLLGDTTLAEELVQETFVRLWRSADRFDPGQGTVRSWIRMLARRVAVDLQRRTAARPRPAAVRLRADGQTIDPVEDLVSEDAVDRAMTGLDVREALEGLSHKHREVLELGYDEGLTQREIAERLEVPLGTVKTRTYTALRALKASLAGFETA